LRNHVQSSSTIEQRIGKEDNILYPMADKHLSGENQRKLAKEFKIVDREKFGIDKQEEFYRLLDNLRRVYLQ